MNNSIPAPAAPVGDPPAPPAAPGYGYPSYGYSSNTTPARWARFYRFLRRLWWVPLLTLACALSAAALRAMLEPPSYISSARMWVSGKMQMAENSYYSEDLQYFFGTQVELMQADKIREAAFNRVQQLNPTMVPCKVKIQAIQAPKSAMFVVRATGEQAAYTQTYLNALIDEYLSYKKQVRATSSDDTLASLSEQVNAREKELKIEQEQLSTYQQENNLAVLQDQGSAAGAYLAKLNSQLSDLKLEDQFLQAMAIDVNANVASTNLLSTASSSVLTIGPLPSPALAPELVTARQQLQLLKFERDDLSPFLRPKHPKMQRLNEEIARAEKLMALYRQQSADQMRDQFDPARQALQMKIDAVQASIKEWEAKLMDSNRRIAQFDRLKANVQRIQSLYEKLLNLLQSLDINKSLDQEIVSVMERANPPRSMKTTPTKLLTTASAGGLAAGLALVFLIARIDDRFTTLNELRDQFEEEIVGQVPEMGKRRRNRKLELVEPNDERHMFAESYRNIRSSVLFMPVDGVRPKILLITSSVPNEGKSTIAANLARTMAFGGGRILLIDADLRKGTIQDLFGLDRGKALSKPLQEQGRIDDFVVPTTVPNLFVLPLTMVPSLSLPASGDLTADSTELFLSGRFDQFLADVRGRYDQIIVDTPPVFAADDAPTIAAKVDGVLFVVRGHFTKARMAREALDILYQRQAKVLGLVFNRADGHSGSYYYYKYSDYYHSGTGKRKGAKGEELSGKG